MLQRFSDSVRRFMVGRYGVDTLSWVLCILGIVLSIVGSMTRQPIFTALAYVPLLWSIFRIFSTNTARRFEENQKFQQFFLRLRGRKDYRYFRCPSCKTRVRVPRGKGKIRISCPSCRESFIKKT